jgi:HD-GYP domain-containing protein (c-di-GMP phosphodiesterase class II)
MSHIGRQSLSSLQLRRFKKFGSRINRFGVNFAVCDADGELLLLCEADGLHSEKEQLKLDALCAMNSQASPCSRGTQGCDTAKATSRRILASTLMSPETYDRQPEVIGVALIDRGEEPCPVDSESFLHADEGRGIARDTQGELFAEVLELLAENFQATLKAEEQTEMVGSELAQTYEELVLLHKLSTHMKVTESDANFLQMACDSLTEIVCVEGIAILLEKVVEGEKKLVVAAGSGLIDMDERMAAVLHSRLAEEINSGAEALLDSEVDSPFKYDWHKGIRNIIAVPLCGKEKADSHFSHRIKNGSWILGLMLAINRIDKPDFDSTDVKLFNSVASGCAVFIENGRLFKDLKELFIGSLKALTSSIDAKDKYTHGHSERVAFISRWIAEKIAERRPLEQEQIYRIYLAGLLHDIGKIGIDEAVLRKEGKLTEHEFDRVRSHPSIGASILGTIKQMRDIVPAVLSHHERVDGRGYPQGLSGEQIPLSAKIVGLADSFDAMTSKRTYRDALSIEQALEEISRCMGAQFDEEVAKVFLESDVYRLWDIIQNGFSEVYGGKNLAEYGTAAIGTLVG